MAYIEERKGKDGKKVFRVQIRMKGHPILSETFTRKEDAKKWARDKETDIERGLHFPQARAIRVTMNDLLDRYMNEIVPRKAKTNQKTDLQRLRWWKREIGDLFINDVTPERIEEYPEKLSQKDAEARHSGKISNTTIGKYLLLLSHVFTMAIKWKYLRESPMRNVEKPAPNAGRVRYLDTEELTAFLKACRESYCPSLYTAVVLSISTGMRRGELWKLTWDKVDLVQGHVILEDTKNTDNRGVPVTGEALDLLRKLHQQRDRVSRLLFPSRKNPNLHFDFTKAFRNAIKAAKLSNFSWHDMRHCAASYLVMNGVSLHTVGEILGHRTPQMTKRYAHLSSDYLKGEMEKMTKKVFGK